MPMEIGRDIEVETLHLSGADLLGRRRPLVARADVRSLFEAPAERPAADQEVRPTPMEILPVGSQLGSGVEFCQPFPRSGGPRSTIPNGNIRRSQPPCKP